MNEETNEIMDNVKEKIKSIDIGKIVLIVVVILIAIYFIWREYEFVNYKGDFKLNGSQVFILDESDELYNKIQVNASKDEVLGLLEKSQTAEVIIRDSSDFNYSFLVEDNVVKRIRRDISSSSYKNVQLSSELKTEIENLSYIIKEVKEGMSLSEVELILGNKYLQKEKNSNGEKVYTWYDKLENSVDIYFGEDGKVSFVSLVWGEY